MCRAGCCSPRAASPVKTADGGAGARWTRSRLGQQVLCPRSANARMLLERDGTSSNRIIGAASVKARPSPPPASKIWAAAIGATCSPAWTPRSGGADRRYAGGDHGRLLWGLHGYVGRITQTHRFRAAVSHAGVSDWLSLEGEAPQAGSDEVSFGGSVYDDPAPYLKASPIMHMRGVNTPTADDGGRARSRMPDAAERGVLHGASGAWRAGRISRVSGGRPSLQKARIARISVSGPSLVSALVRCRAALKDGGVALDCGVS
jgi:hypothetical protein